MGTLPSAALSTRAMWSLWLLLLPLLCNGEGDSQLLDFTHNPAIWAYSQDPTYWLYNQDQAILGYHHDSSDVGYSQNWPILGYRSQIQELPYPRADIHLSSSEYMSGQAGYQLQPVAREREVVLPPLHNPAPLPPLHSAGNVGGSRVRGAEQHPVIGRAHQQLPPPVSLPNLATTSQLARQPAHTRVIANPFELAGPRTAAGSVSRPAVHHLPAVPSRASTGGNGRFGLRSQSEVALPLPSQPGSRGSSQYHAQDEAGNVAYGYQNENSARHEVGVAGEAVVGSYSYRDEAGLHTVSYIADRDGFRLL